MTQDDIKNHAGNERSSQMDCTVMLLFLANAEGCTVSSTHAEVVR